MLALRLRKAKKIRGLKAEFLEDAHCELRHFGKVIFENGSTPPLRLGQKLPHNARVVVCNKPGSFAARNFGMSKATGDLLAFTDADCIPARDWLAQGVKIVTENPLNVVGGEIILQLSEQPTGVELYQYIRGFMQKENITERKFTATANVFVTAEVAQTIGEFNNTLLSGGDREWSWRANKLGHHVIYGLGAVVTTPPRRKITSAILQTRRVAGGRFDLKQQDQGSQPTNTSTLSAVQLKQSTTF